MRKVSSGFLVLVAVANKASHPNAAKVFINWLLTMEGQTMWSEQTLMPSFRTDVPTGHANPAVIRKPGKTYLEETPETFAKRDYYLELSKRVFAPVLPK